MALIEAVIPIPANSNASVPFTEVEWAALYARLASVAEGATRRGPHSGVWIDPQTGTEYSEPVFEIEVGIESWMQIGAFVEVARWALSHFDQRAIFIKIAGVPEVLRE